MKPRNLSYILAGMLALFTATKWRGLAYWQKFMFVAVLYCVVGVWAYYGGKEWLMLWAYSLLVFIVFSVYFLIKKLLNL